MKVQVRLFARAREVAGTELLTVELPAPATVADLRRALAVLQPRLAGLLAHSVLAVAQEYAGEDTLLTSDVEIALLPPVSGG